MSHAAADLRLAESPDALEVSYDNGASWIRCVRASEQNTAEAWARGNHEFVQHRSRKHDYPHGAIFRWHGAPLLSVEIISPSRYDWTHSEPYRVHFYDQTKRGTWFRYFSSEGAAVTFARDHRIHAKPCVVERSRYALSGAVSP